MLWSAIVPLLLQVFKGHNVTWAKTEVVITDKDMAERSVFSAAFPTASLQLCLFHTLRSISREVTTEKMGVRSGQRDVLLGIFNKMAYAATEAVFDEQCTLLAEMDVPAASAYFERNWLPIKKEWVSCYKGRCFNLGESTNNRLESLNGKIKSVCTRFASLYTFFQDFFSVLRVLRGERTHASVIARVSKLSTEVAIISGDDELYRSLTTAYAYSLIVGQIARRSNVKLPANGAPVISSEGQLLVTDSTCNCRFRVTHRLPCRHIFARRLMNELSSYDASLVDARWVADRLPVAYLGDSSVGISPLPSSPAPRVLTGHQKYRQAMLLATDLANLASEVGMRQFTSRLEILKRLRDEWSAGATGE